MGSAACKPSSSADPGTIGVMANATLERRLGAVYDALDNRNPKAALKLCDALLEKYKGNHMVLALKGLSLSRLRRREDANKVCDDLMSHLPLESWTLHTVKLLLRDLHRWSDLTKVYQAAVDLEPNNPELMVGMFGAHARQHNYVKQQQVALQLAKATGGKESEQAHWWSITSLVLQVRSAVSSGQDLTGRPAQLLQLAESMATRQAKKPNGGGLTFEGLLLWLDMYMARGQPQAALELLQGPLCANVTMQAEERDWILMGLHRAAGDVSAAVDILKKRLLKDPQDWMAVQAYLDLSIPSTAMAPIKGAHTELLAFVGSLQQLQSRRRRLSQGAKDDEQKRQQDGDDLLSCEQFVSELVQTCEQQLQAGSKHIARGPRLAMVELAHRKSLLTQNAEDHQALASAVLEYWQQAGHLASCAADVRPYTRQLPNEQATWLWDALGGAELTAAPEQHFKTVDDLRRRVSALQIGSDVNMPALTTTQEALQYAQHLMSLYVAALPHQQAVDSRAPGPGDDLPVLAAAAMVQAACRCSSSSTAAASLLLTAAIMLEAVVVSRPFASAARLSLASLHALLACSAPCAAQLEALDIKNIQLESVASHLLLPSLSATHMAEVAEEGHDGAGKKKARTLPRVKCEEGLSSFLDATLTVFSDHDRDSGDTLDMAYKHDAYAKVLEFVAFGERLTNSYSRAICRCEAVAGAARSAVADAPSSSSLAASLVSAAAEPGQKHGLPWSDLPQQGAVFTNQDWATRPTWLPPQSCQPSLHTATWWTHRQEYANCARSRSQAWWMTPGIALQEPPYTARQAHADTVVAGMTASCRFRWASLHVVLRAMSILDATAAEHAKDIPGLVQDTQQAMEVVKAGAQALSGQDVSGDVPSMAISATLASVSAAHDVCSVVGSTEVTDAAVDIACSSLQSAVTQLQLCVEGLCSNVKSCSGSSEPDVAANPVMAAGSVEALLAVLTEPVAWFVAVTEAVIQRSKASSKSKGKKASDKAAATATSASVPPSLVLRAKECLKHLQQCLSTAIEVSASVSKSLAGDVDSGLHALQCAVSGGQDTGEASVSSLWSWQEAGDFSAAAVLMKVVNTQTCLVNSVKTVAAALLTRSKAQAA